MNEPTVHETRITGGLPSLDVQIVHREHRDEPAESLTITLKASPSFEVAAQRLAPLAMASLVHLQPSALAASPFALWSQWMQAAWAPMLQSMQMPFALLQRLGAPGSGAGSSRGASGR